LAYWGGTSFSGVLSGFRDSGWIHRFYPESRILLFTLSRLVPLE